MLLENGLHHSSHCDKIPMYYSTTCKITRENDLKWTISSITGEKSLVHLLKSLVEPVT